MPRPRRTAQKQPEGLCKQALRKGRLGKRKAASIFQCIRGKCRVPTNARAYICAKCRMPT